MLNIILETKMHFIKNVSFKKIEDDKQLKMVKKCYSFKMNFLINLSLSTPWSGNGNLINPGFLRNPKSRVLKFLINKKKCFISKKTI